MSLADILAGANFSFEKKFGQNFITDKNLLAAIVDEAGITGGTVLEIGAGAGTLTRALAAKADRVISYEIDKNLAPVLSQTLAGLDERVEVVFRDIMKESDEELDKSLGGEYKLVANLPYYITTPIIMRFIERANRPLSISVMVQKEVGERLAASPGTADYGAITAAVALEGSASITRIVPRTMFTPRPNVDSCVVRIDMHDKYAGADKPLVKKLIKAAFAMRRKTLVNNLCSSLNLARAAAEQLLASCGYDVRIRGEKLGVEDFIRLAETLRAQRSV